MVGRFQRQHGLARGDAACTPQVRPQIAMRLQPASEMQPAAAMHQAAAALGSPEFPQYWNLEVGFSLERMAQTLAEVRTAILIIILTQPAKNKSAFLFIFQNPGKETGI